MLPRVYMHFSVKKYHNHRFYQISKSLESKNITEQLICGGTILSKNIRKNE